MAHYLLIFYACLIMIHNLQVANLSVVLFVRVKIESLATFLFLFCSFLVQVSGNFLLANQIILEESYFSRSAISFTILECNFHFGFYPFNP